MKKIISIGTGSIIEKNFSRAGYIDGSNKMEARVILDGGVQGRLRKAIETHD